jgi:hypothetical protein
VSHETLEVAAAVVLVLSGLCFLAVAARRARSGGGTLGPGAVLRSSSADAGNGRSIAITVAAASLGAAIVHFALAPHHIEELGLLGWGFIVAGVLQAASALAVLRRPNPGAVWLTIALNLALIGAWAWSRTTGLPIGPAAWQPEAIGRADVVCVILEAAIIGLLAFWLRAIRHSQSESRSLFASVGLVPAVGLAALLTVLALAGGDEGHTHADDHEHAQLSAMH